MPDYTNNAVSAPKSHGSLGGQVGYAASAPQPAVGLDYAGMTIERLGKQLGEIYTTLEHKHVMIYGPVPQAVGDQKIGGGSGLLYELSRLCDAGEQIASLAASL